MAEITLAGGLVVDVASGKELADHADKLLDGIRGAGPSKPTYQTRWGAAVTPAAGATTTVVRLGKPATGRVWNLVYLTVAGSDDRTAVAGATVASYVGDPDAPMLHGLIDPANGTAVPKSANYGPEEIWIHDNEELFVVVYGAPNNQQLAAVARVLEHLADDREAGRM